MTRLSSTWSTAGTVLHRATPGSKRWRAKYRNRLTVCRILNRREAYVLGRVPHLGGVYGRVDTIKFSWGCGHPKHGQRDGSSVGWYGEWHVQTDGRSRPLWSFADLRAEYHANPPRGGDWSDPGRLTGNYCASLKALRR